MIQILNHNKFIVTYSRHNKFIVIQILNHDKFIVMYRRAIVAVVLWEGGGRKKVNKRQW